MPSYGSAGARGDGSSSNTGNQISGRSSTRVVQQPGGNSSFSLGWGDPSNANRVVHKQPTYAPKQQIFGSGIGGGNTNHGAPAHQAYNTKYSQPKQQQPMQGYHSAAGGAPANSRGGYQSQNYIPRSLNTQHSDSLEAMAGGQLHSSPMTRQREQRNELGQLPCQPVSPKVSSIHDMHVW